MKKMTKAEIIELIDSMENELKETYPVYALGNIYNNEMPYNAIRFDKEIGFFYAPAGILRPNDKRKYHSGEIWECLLALAKHLFLKDRNAYLNSYNYPSVEVERETIRKIQEMSREQQNLAVEMMGEVAQVFNKYYRLANPDVIYNGQIYPVKVLENEEVQKDEEVQNQEILAAMVD